MAYQSLNPATGQLLKKFDELTDKQLEDKLATAGKCFKTWKRLL
jgi:succinate-semialdehyde dehydrogenase / glutarate-semialdehyde dehydrogenase